MLMTSAVDGPADSGAGLAAVVAIGSDDGSSDDDTPWD
jgi:hypothetical protein